LTTLHEILSTLGFTGVSETAEAHKVPVADGAGNLDSSWFSSVAEATINRVKGIYYMSPYGNDADNGSCANPVATYARVEELVAEDYNTSTRKVVVVMGPGNYGTTIAPDEPLTTDIAFCSFSPKGLVTVSQIDGQQGAGHILIQGLTVTTLKHSNTAIVFNVTATSSSITTVTNKGPSAGTFSLSHDTTYGTTTSMTVDRQLDAGMVSYDGSTVAARLGSAEVKLATVESGAQVNVGEEYTEAEQTKLATVESGAQVNVGEEYTEAEQTKLATVESGAQVNVGEEYTTAEKDKLTGIETGAQVNVGEEYTEAEQTKLATVESGAQVNVGEEYTEAEQTKLATVESGAQVNVGEEYTTAEKDKLATVESGAQVNVGEEYTTVEKDKLATVASGAQVNVGEEYTTVEKDKLATVESGAQVNVGEEYTEAEKDKLALALSGADIPDTFLGHEGISGNMQKNKYTGTYVTIQDQLAGPSAPTESHDASLGYAVGSRWLDVAHKRVYCCLDATAGSADWKELRVSTVTSVNWGDIDNKPLLYTQSEVDAIIIDTKKYAKKMAIAFS